MFWRRVPRLHPPSLTYTLASWVHKIDELHFTCRPDNIAAADSLRHEECNSWAAFLCYGQRNVCFVQRPLRKRLAMTYSVLWLRFLSFKIVFGHILFSFLLIIDGYHLSKFCGNDGKQQSVTETAESNSEWNTYYFSEFSFFSEPRACGGEGKESFAVPWNSLTEMDLTLRLDMNFNTDL